MPYYKFVETPIGILKIVSDGEFINEILPANAFGDDRSDELCQRAAAELFEYFQGKRRSFSVPISPCGTEFRKKVWAELIKIPFGKVCTYGEIARRIGAINAQRAVGGAVGKNPVLIMIPCHRIVAKSGLGGFSCGLWRKKILCETENINICDIDNR